MNFYSELFNSFSVRGWSKDAVRRCEKCIIPHEYIAQYTLRGECECCSSAHVTPLGADALLEELGDEGKIAVSVSGGKDSTYTWLWLTEHLGADRIAAVNFSHTGLQHPTAVSNIQKTASILSTEMIYIQDCSFKDRFVKNLEIFLDDPRPELVRVVLCAGCRHGISVALYNECSKRGIYKVVNSASYLELAPFKRALLRELGHGDPEKGLSSALGMNDKYDWGNNLDIIWRDNQLEYKNGISTGAISKIGDVLLFDFDEYIPNNPKLFEETITSKLNWRRPERSWHFDCLIEEFKDVFYYGLLGYTEADFKLSAMVHYELLSREEALRQISVFNEAIRNSLDHMIALMHSMGIYHLDEKMRRFYETSTFLFSSR